MNNAERASNVVRSKMGKLVRGKALNPGKPMTFAEAITLLMVSPLKAGLVMWTEDADETGYCFLEHDGRVRFVTERVARGRGFNTPPSDQELELGAQLLGVQVTGACLTPWLLSMPVWTVCEPSTIEPVAEAPKEIVTEGADAFDKFLRSLGVDGGEAPPTSGELN
jgi:hypothetical protein